MKLIGQNVKKGASVIYSHAGFRGLAAMYVVFFHLLDSGDNLNQNLFYYFFSFGQSAVDFFFILSGFILNWVYLQKPDPLDWSSYLRARVARILPLYYLTMFLFIPLIIYSLVHHGFKFKQSFSSSQDFLVGLIQNLLLVSGVINGPTNTIIPPAWSISVEFFCYLLIFPLLVFLYRVMEKKSYGIVVMVGLVGILSPCLVASYDMDLIPIWKWHWNGSWLSRGIAGFSIGFCLASIFQKSSKQAVSVAVINLIVLVSIIAILLAGLNVLPSYGVLYSLPCLTFFTAFDQGFVANFLKMPFFQWLGDRSYSVYLWHLPLVRLGSIINHHVSGVVHFGLVFPMMVGLILLTSNLSYRYFECPMRDYIRRYGQKNAPPN